LTVSLPICIPFISSCFITLSRNLFFTKGIKLTWPRLGCSRDDL
jgi:hypothetical protein